MWFRFQLDVVDSSLKLLLCLEQYLNDSIQIFLVVEFERKTKVNILVLSNMGLGSVLLSHLLYFQTGMEAQGTGT